MSTTLNLPLFYRVAFGFEGEIKTKQIHKPSNSFLNRNHNLRVRPNMDFNAMGGFPPVIRKIVCNIV